MEDYAELFYHFMNLMNIKANIYGYEISWLDVFIFAFGVYCLKSMIWAILGDD